MQPLFQTLDLLLERVDLDATACSPQTLLCLPLSVLFEHMPTDHRLLKKRSTVFLVRHFFLFDPLRLCLRPFTRQDNPPFPRLSAVLWRDLMVHRTLQFSPRFVNVLTSPPDSAGDFDDSPFLRQFLLSAASTLHHTDLRHLALNALLPCPPSEQTKEKWRVFWKLPIRPDTRTFWYRVQHGKILSQKAISHFHPDSPDSCFFCHAPKESPAHLLVECPLKWKVWFEVLTSFAPYLRFRPTDVLQILHNLATFDYISPTKLFSLCAATVLAIWQCH
ncbi:hypothetical protein BD560DRAFT_360918 [Blakeslea trispora]|nr:hypothetical protein BD560DRAFT_360918 [Blakeslea trispora]